MKISFINQVSECRRLITLLSKRAYDDQSSFAYQIDAAKYALDNVYNMYNEVLERDANEDQTYRSPLKEIK
jgi:hypothetical protein